jgi:hypothetical protein
MVLAVSDIGVFCFGMGLGLIVVAPILFVLRHEIAQNARNLLGEFREEEDRPAGDPGGGAGAANGASNATGISPTAAAFCLAAAALVVVWGAMAGGIIFVLSGGFLAVAVLAVLFIGKRGRSRR